MRPKPLLCAAILAHLVSSAYMQTGSRKAGAENGKQREDGNGKQREDGTSSGNHQEKEEEEILYTTTFPEEDRVSYTTTYTQAEDIRYTTIFPQEEEIPSTTRSPKEKTEGSEEDEDVSKNKMKYRKHEMQHRESETENNAAQFEKQRGGVSAMQSEHRASTGKETHSEDKARDKTEPAESKTRDKLKQFEYEFQLTDDDDELDSSIFENIEYVKDQKFEKKMTYKVEPSLREDEIKDEATYLSYVLREKVELAIKEQLSHYFKQYYFTITRPTIADPVRTYVDFKCLFSFTHKKIEVFRTLLRFKS